MQKMLNAKLAQKEKLLEIGTELAHLNDTIAVANDLLPYETELKHSDRSQDIEDKAKKIEELERLLNTQLNYLEGSDFSIMTENMRANAEMQRNAAVPLLNRLRALKDAVRSHLKALSDWKSSEAELTQETRVPVDSARILAESYSQPQPYPKAVDDAERLHELQDQLGHLLQKAIDVEQAVREALPECQSANVAIRAARQDLEKSLHTVQVSHCSFCTE